MKEPAANGTIAAPITRRAVLGAATAVVATTGIKAEPVGAMPIIDTHIHLFDPNRPQCAPYRGPKTAPYYTRGALPETYAGLMRRNGVIGAIEVEASPWIEDNLWVLETASRDDIMVGTIGNLQPDKPEFGEYLERYHRNPLFRGVRYGNLWKYDIVAQSQQAPFIAGLKLLADADLVLDTANPRVDLLQALVRINDLVPSLRIVIDHLPKLEPAPEERAAYEAVLREIAQRPQLSAKLSAVIHPVNNVVSTRLADHKQRLDQLFEIFGEDRVLFGSDWPNVEGDTPVDNEIAIVKAYFSGKTRIRQEKYFWRNSIKIYKWKPRNTAQRALIASAG